MCLTNPQMNGDQLYLSLPELVLEVILGHARHELLFGKQSAVLTQKASSQFQKQASKESWEQKQTYCCVFPQN